MKELSNLNINLEDALRGEPIRVADGRRGYIRYVETEKLKYDTIYTGIVEYKDEPNMFYQIAWDIKGKNILGFVTNNSREDDIVGMYNSKMIVNGQEVPSAVTHPLTNGSQYYIPDLLEESKISKMTWNDTDKDMLALKRGLVHLSLINAITHANALLNSSTEE